MSAVPDKRVSSACQRCRQRKVKCSGDHPCANCLRRHSECVFDHDGRRVLVSQRYLRNLERSAQNKQKPSPRVDGEHGQYTRNSISSTHTPRDGTLQPAGHAITSDVAQSVNIGSEAERDQVNEANDGEESDSDGDLTNPLVAATASYVIDTAGRNRALGESSTWSFCRRTFALAQNLFASQFSAVALNEQGTAYDLSWTDRPGNVSDIDCLPSYEYALHLTNLVKFHVGNHFHVLDDALFSEQLERFYKMNDTSITDSNRLWVIQLLIVLSFGKAFSTRNKTSRSPPGAELFTRAVMLLPDPAYLYTDTLTSIEILCAIALYLQSADHRNVAYIYIGQAMRMALTYGLHRDRPVATQDDHSERCRSIWWTIYILDHSFSSSMGVPTSLRDRDITVALPLHHHSGEKSAVTSFYVRISRSVAEVVDSVYGPDGRLHQHFLPSIHRVLSSAADLGRDLETAFPLTPYGRAKGVSRIAANLNVFYHHMILLAVYPLLFCLLERRMQEVQLRSSRQSKVSRRTRALLQNSAESASKTIRILSMLQDEDQLESFLPFDLEHAFSAGFVLTMISIVLPDAAMPPILKQQLHAIFEYFRSMGNRPSTLRMTELIALEKLQQLLESADCAPDRSTLQSQEADASTFFDPGNGSRDVFFDLGDLSTLSSGQLMDITELLAPDADPMSTSDTWFEDWVWDQSSVPSQTMAC